MEEKRESGKARSRETVKPGTGKRRKGGGMGNREIGKQESERQKR